ncbi:hypothetical protein ES703_91494 [subsurface metagenome]|jgi:hypothetical protein
MSFSISVQPLGIVEKVVSTSIAIWAMYKSPSGQTEGILTVKSFIYWVSFVILVLSIVEEDLSDTGSVVI